MRIYIKNQDGLVIPKTGSEKSAGYDIVATSDPIIVGTKHDDIEGYWKSIDYIEYKTGVFIAPQPRLIQNVDMNRNPVGVATELESYHTYIFPRSSISKYNLSLCNSVGLIDNDYRGEIGFRFKYIIQPKDLMYAGKTFGVEVDLEKVYKKGDRIGQLVAEETIRIEFIPVDDLDKTERGTGGFGSTDAPPILIRKGQSPILTDSEAIKIRSAAPKQVELTEPTERKFTEDKPYSKTAKPTILDKWKENAQITDVVGYEKLVKGRETNEK